MSLPQAPTPRPTSWPAEDLETLGRCPVCQAPERSLRHADVTDRLFGCAPGLWQVYTCAACRASYVDPRPNLQSIGRAYGNYFTHNDGIAAAPAAGPRRWIKAALNGFRRNQWGLDMQPAWPLAGRLLGLFAPVRALIVTHMRHLPPRLPRPGARLLDVGCGNGLYLDLARAAGWQVSGVDFDAAAVASAQARGLDVRLGGLEQLRDQLGNFDRLTCSHVIEHVHAPKAWLLSMHAMLRPGGSLWLQTPNVDALGHARFGRDWLGLDAPRHLSLLSPATLVALLEECGFTVRLLPLPALMALSVYQDSAAMAGGQPQIGARLRGKSFTQGAWLADAWAQQRRLAQAEFITVEATKK